MTSKKATVYIFQILAIFLAALVVSCGSGEVVKNAGSAPHEPIRTFAERGLAKNLSRDEATQRSILIKNVNYALNFMLSAEQPSFSATATLSFDLLAQKNLTVDFDDGQIQTLTINGTKIEKFDYNGVFVTLPAAALKVGKNEVKFDFTHAYSLSGNGLYRFKDPEDGKVYLYTDFEPYAANKLFPCFDQPDLKAMFKIEALAPKDWVVISAGEVEKITPAEGANFWEFKKVGPFSTYLISLHGGPYKVWNSRAGGIPLRLFARQSVARYVIPQDWFTVTKQGLGFYQKYFNFAYPFKKFDEIIVPDFNEGAMENVAAITFSERYIKRGKPTLDDREDLAGTILHEMAHMWFGDLVTMKWWNDLWLNESFATFASGLSQGAATEFKSSWYTFFTSDKQWAYWQDQLVTTHPIEGSAVDTDAAFASFDGITYGKGASALKQLAFYVGSDAFRDGVGDYFKTHAFKNATLADFISAVQNHTKLDLEKWKSDWLQSSGVNGLEAKFTCADGKLNSFSLEQRPDQGSGILRTHRTQVALFDRDMYGTIKLRKSLPVIYSGASTEVAAFKGEKCPVLVQPNYADYDYVKVTLDPVSLNTASTQIERVSDSFSRAMLWESLWEMTREAKLSASQYAALVFSHLSGEADFKIVDLVLTSVVGSRDQLSLIRFFHSYDTDRAKTEVEFRERLETFLSGMLEKAKPSSDLQKRIFDAYAATVVTAPAKIYLVDLLEGRKVIAGFEFDQDRRWNVLYRLASLDAPEFSELLKKESARDASGEGVKKAIAAQAALPGFKNKQDWFARFFNDKNLSLAQVRAAMQGLYPLEQFNLRGQMTDDFTAHATEVATVRDSEFQEFYSAYLAPAICTQESVDKVRGILTMNLKLTAIMIKNLKINIQENERCLNVKSLMESTSSH